MAGNSKRINRRKFLITAGAAGLVAVGGGLAMVSILRSQPQPVTQIATSITDMWGRKLITPTVINRVLTTTPIEMELVYMLAPDKLAGLSKAWTGSPPLVPDKYKNLPLVGGWYGTETGNYETFIAQKPDIILDGGENQPDPVAAINDRQAKFGSIPVVGVKAWVAVDTYEDVIRYTGELLGAQERSENLITYYNDAMKYVKSITSQIPDNEKVKVYYAEGKEGFSTDPAGSQHTQLLDFCGAKNVADVVLKPGYGMADVTLEQILLWDPDMILIGRQSQASLYKTVMTDSRWSQTRAVKNGKVAVRPENPVSWFDGPPGPSQIVGMYWMVNKLYPDKTKGLDLSAKVKEFYSKFLSYELTDADVASLLANPS